MYLQSMYSYSTQTKWFLSCLTFYQIKTLACEVAFYWPLDAIIISNCSSSSCSLDKQTKKNNFLAIFINETDDKMFELNIIKACVDVGLKLCIWKQKVVNTVFYHVPKVPPTYFVVLRYPQVPGLVVQSWFDHLQYSLKNYRKHFYLKKHFCWIGPPVPNCSP